ncbi:hypothetical protein BD410DRAFT_892629 [Rickenella mellea]|uniref:Uncharacterized protein n=1 Tax=Rickenella mellea TaxID=50990 RepID=A0A4R5XGK4_9AGAM|nr:hypothetical protein BD410DRAFT_892629 [Rickenella mellea]
METTLRLPNVNQNVHNAVKANKDHQYTLKVHTERLESELKALDKLITSAETVEEPEDVEVEDRIRVIGGVKPTSVLLASSLMSEDSPFCADAHWRNEYMDSITVIPMKAKEEEALATAVRAENHRIHALEAQRRGADPYALLQQHPQTYFEQNTQGLDWERIALKFTSLIPAGVKRSPKECEIHWLGFRHPRFNHVPWSADETSRLKSIVSKQSEHAINWTDVAEELGTHRTPIDCMRFGITRKNHVWSDESDLRLLQAVERFGFNNWQLVARHVSEDVTGHQCQKRYQDTLDPNLKRGSWSQEEDEHLRAAVEAFGTSSWQSVSEFIPGRTNNQCRERYQDRLNPSGAKGRWTEEEDSALLALVADLGEARWTDVSSRIQTGRTDAMCRRRYAALQRKKETAADMSVQPSHTGSVASSSENIVLDEGELSVPDGHKKQSKRRLREQTSQDDANNCSPVEQAQPKSARPRPRPRIAKKSTPTKSNASGAIEPTPNTTREATADTADKLHSSPSTPATPRLTIKIPRRKQPADNKEASNLERRRTKGYVSVAEDSVTNEEPTALSPRKRKGKEVLSAAASPAPSQVNSGQVAPPSSRTRSMLQKYKQQETQIDVQAHTVDRSDVSQSNLSMNNTSSAVFTSQECDHGKPPENRSHLFSEELKADATDRQVHDHGGHMNLDNSELSDLTDLSDSD